MTDDPRRVIRVKLDQLKPHPRQEALFSDLTDGELEELARDMQARGQQHPIEVLPDYTIVAGHQRIRAARRLAWLEVGIVVRHDLAVAGELATEQHLITDNLMRRQMGRLERARCANRLMELQAGGSLNKLSDYRRTDSLRQMRESVGRMLGIGEREVARLMQVVHTPVEVQAAYDRGQIGIADVNRVSRSGEEKKEELAAAIRGGEYPKDAFRRIYGGGPPRRQTTEEDQAYSEFLQAIQTAIEILGPRPGRIVDVAMPRKQRYRTLREGIELIRSLQERETNLSRGGSDCALDEPCEEEHGDDIDGEDECGTAA